MDQDENERWRRSKSFLKSLGKISCHAPESSAKFGKPQKKLPHLPTSSETAAEYGTRSLGVQEAPSPAAKAKPGYALVTEPISPLPGPSSSPLPGSESRPKRKSAEHVKEVTWRLKGIYKPELTPIKEQEEKKTKKKAEKTGVTMGETEKGATAGKPDEASEELEEARQMREKVYEKGEDPGLLTEVREKMEELKDQRAKRLLRDVARRLSSKQSQNGLKSPLVPWPKKQDIIKASKAAPTKLRVALKLPSKKPKPVSNAHKAVKAVAAALPQPPRGPMKLPSVQTAASLLRSLPSLIATAYLEESPGSREGELRAALGKTMGPKAAARLISSPSPEKKNKSHLQTSPIAATANQAGPSKESCAGCKESRLLFPVPEAEYRILLCRKCQEPFPRFLSDPMEAIWAVCPRGGRRDGQSRCSESLGKCEPCWFWRCVRLVQSALEEGGGAESAIEVPGSGLAKVRYCPRKEPEEALIEAEEPKQSSQFGLSALPQALQAELEAEEEEGWLDETPVGLSQRRAYIERMVAIRRFKEAQARSQRLGREAAPPDPVDGYEIPEGSKIEDFGIIPTPETQLLMRDEGEQPSYRVVDIRKSSKHHIHLISPKPSASSPSVPPPQDKPGEAVPGGKIRRQRPAVELTEELEEEEGPLPFCRPEKATEALPPPSGKPLRSLSAIGACQSSASATAQLLSQVREGTFIRPGRGKKRRGDNDFTYEDDDPDWAPGTDDDEYEPKKKYMGKKKKKSTYSILPKTSGLGVDEAMAAAKHKATMRSQQLIDSCASSWRGNPNPVPPEPATGPRKVVKILAPSSLSCWPPPQTPRPKFVVRVAAPPGLKITRPVPPRPAQELEFLESRGMEQHELSSLLAELGPPEGTERETETPELTEMTAAQLTASVAAAQSRVKESSINLPLSPPIIPEENLTPLEPIENTEPMEENSVMEEKDEEEEIGVLHKMEAFGEVEAPSTLDAPPKLLNQLEYL